MLYSTNLSIRIRDLYVGKGLTQARTDIFLVVDILVDGVSFRTYLKILDAQANF
jgi:hypothetical protein